jgi:hypothetical protein
MFYYDGWPKLCEFENCSDSFSPFIAKKVHFPNSIAIEDIYSSTDKTIDISCVSLGKEFSGDESKSEYVPLSAKSYIEGFLAVSGGKSHWISQVKDLQLYLSQIPLWTSSPSTSENILSSDRFPSILANRDMYQCNMWANINPAVTTLHYDGNHNILFVASGHKDVLLLSPAHTTRLQANGVFSTSPHHSSLSAADLASMFPITSFPTPTPATPATSVLPSGAYRVRVEPGDALFIPEGWWHQVSSGHCTYALNFWFRSPLYRMLHGHAHGISTGDEGVSMAQYLFRASLAHMLSASSNESARAATLASSPAISLAGICHLFESMPSLSYSSPTVTVTNALQGDCESVVHELCRLFAGASLADMWEVWVPASSLVHTTAHNYHYHTLHLVVSRDALVCCE